MSHWVKVQTTIQDLSALREAAKAMGFKTEENATARGYTNSQFDMVIRLPGAYDIGVSRAMGFNNKFELHADFWQGHVERSVGKGAGLLLQQYGIAVAKREARRRGKRLTQRKQSDGSVQLIIQ